MTKVLNIDAISNPELMSLVIKGVTHEMKAPSLNDFIANLKDIEELSEAETQQNIGLQMAVIVRMIARAYPTLTIAEMMEWDLAKVTYVFNAIRGAEDTAEVEDKDGEGKSKDAP